MQGKLVNAGVKLFFGIKGSHSCLSCRVVELFDTQVVCYSCHIFLSLTAGVVCVTVTEDLIYKIINALYCYVAVHTARSQIITTVFCIKGIIDLQ